MFMLQLKYDGTWNTMMLSLLMNLYDVCFNDLTGHQHANSKVAIWDK